MGLPGGAGVSANMTGSALPLKGHSGYGGTKWTWGDQSRRHFSILGNDSGSFAHKGRVT